MADTKISALTAATTPLAGTEVLPIVQSSTTKKVSVENMTAGRAISFAGGTSTANLWLQDATLLEGGYTSLRWSIGGVGELYITPRTGYDVVFNGSSRCTLQGTFDTKIWLRDAATLEGGYNTLRWSIGGVGDLEITPRSGYNTKLVDGNLVIGTSGKGIDFSATASGSGTMVSELLADYEEGIWTPTYTSTSASFSYAQQEGVYVKIGAFVFVQFYLNATASGTTSNTIYLTNLPFTTANLNVYEQCGGAAWFTGTKSCTPLSVSNDTKALLWQNNVAAATLVASDVSGQYFVGSLTYKAA